MKTTILLLCALATSQMLNATVHTVSNEPGYPAQYTTIADAIAAAAAGDTLYLSGSGTNYGDITLTMPLAIIGVGYNIGSAASQVSSVYCEAGSAGSKFIGLYLAGYIYPSYTAPNTNILIERCRIYGTDASYPMDGLIIKNCVIVGGINMGSDWTNVLITNNLITGAISGSTSPSVLISNNVFVGDPFYYRALGDISYAVISNNIFYYQSYVSGVNPYVGAQNCAFNNNISYLTNSDALPPATGSNVGSGNLVGVDPLFVNVPDYYFNLSYDYHLQAGSPGKNAGTDGTDIGLYGGGAPLVGMLDGVPRLPLVTTFNLLNTSIGVGGSLNVEVEGSKHD